MRYLKILFLALFIFFAVLFFIQNQAPLSQEMVLTLNLFFIPVCTSIPLPFYFIVAAAFCIGCILSILWFMWDKVMTTSRLMKRGWKISNLEKEVANLKKQMNDYHGKLEKTALPAASAEDAPEQTKAE